MAELRERELVLVVIGVRHDDETNAIGDLGGGIVVNPPTHEIMRFASGDQVIGIAGR